MGIALDSTPARGTSFLPRPSSPRDGSPSSVSLISYSSPTRRAVSADRLSVCVPPPRRKGAGQMRRRRGGGKDAMVPRIRVFCDDGHEDTAWDSEDPDRVPVSLPFSKSAGNMEDVPASTTWEDPVRRHGGWGAASMPTVAHLTSNTVTLSASPSPATPTSLTPQHHNKWGGSLENLTKRGNQAIHSLGRKSGSTVRWMLQETNKFATLGRRPRETKRPSLFSGLGKPKTEANAADTQPTWRHWGEDHEEDAIYAVYLKKVRYHRPAKAVSSDNEDDISHLEWETVKVRLIKAGTLPKLVESLASDSGELESTYVNVFLATYRTFATAEEVLRLMQERYVALQQSPPSPLVPEELRSDYLRTCRQTIAVWLDAFPEDFYQPPEHRLLSNLSTFLEEHCPDPQLQAKVKNLLERNPIAAHDEDGSFVPGSGTGSDSDSGLGLPRCVSPLPSSLLNTVRYSNFMDIPSETVAEQITRMDADCFRRLLPHQCLGAIWSKKAAHPERCASVRACVDHFNAVSFRVLSTVLTDSDIRPSQRAKVIAKWIEVAQELRLLKNFSSLKAIISGLQSTPIYRLRKVWLSVPREKVELFEELSRLVSEENNQSVPRELLIREGTSKTAQVISDRDKQLPRAIMKQSSSHALRGVRYGTIPYLGTFLTDLNMVDTAHPNTIGPKNLINFDKRRKEFEILAQIKLLQGSASAYSIPVDDRFTRWFDACPSLDDKAAFELSCLIEPQGQPHGHSHSPGYLPPTPGRRNKPSHAPSITRHQKSDSIASNSSGASSGPGAAELSDSMTSATDGVSFDRKMSTSSSCSSLPSLDVSLVSSTAAPQSPTTTLTTTANTPATKNRPPFNSSRSTPTGCKYEDSSPTASSPHPPHTRQSFLSSKSKSSAQLLTPSSKSQDISSSSTPSPYRTPEYYIIRVSIEDPASEQQGVNLYKSIMLSNNERTPAVIRNAMLKHGIEGKADEYTLAQILPHGEMVFPSTGNVYYAINTSHDLNFILRRKKPGEEIQKTGIRMREVNSRGAHAKKKLINLMT